MGASESAHDIMALVAGLYTNLGVQTKLGDPTDVKANEMGHRGCYLQESALVK